MTLDTKNILRELAVIETGIAIIIEQQDAILKHFELQRSNPNPSDQSTEAYALALNGIKERLRKAGESVSI